MIRGFRIVNVLTKPRSHVESGRVWKVKLDISTFIDGIDFNDDNNESYRRIWIDFQIIFLDVDFSQHKIFQLMPCIFLASI